MQGLRKLETDPKIMAVPDKITITNVRLADLQKISYVKCPYCRSKETASQLSDHIEKSCPLSPPGRARHIAGVIQKKGFEVALGRTCVAAHHTRFDRNVFVRSIEVGELDGYYIGDGVRSFYVDYLECIERISWLVKDWERGLKDRDYAES